ncbi:MAG TPA: hypothetical protein VK684_06460 [Edaphobacter sp.]|jgi:outer membrane lipoprotein SlyB|nr:hypothetical protein [Edaphobacter sp.]
MSRLRKAVLLTPLLVATSIIPMVAQNHRNNDSAYYNGMRNGARGGNYYNDRDPRYNNNYQPDYHNDHRQGGIGPGKGALIGGAGGAALGALFGGGLKGTLIGGAAGAGIGAVVGQAAQNKRNNDNSYHRPY